MPLPSGATGWWPLDEGQGTTAADLAGAANDGTHVNGPTPVTGYVSGALRFDGVNDYVYASDHPELDVGAASFTIDAWVRTEWKGQGVVVLQDKRDQKAGYHLHLYRSAQWTGGRAVPALNVTYLPAGSPGYENHNAVNAPEVADGRWHHIAAVADVSRREVRIYLDGQLVYTGASRILGNNLDNASDFYLGMRSPLVGGGGHFPGELDEVELFQRALTLQEIQALYHAGPAGKCKGTPDLAIVKRAGNTPWTVGGTGTFSISVSNVGNGTVAGGTVITVTDNLPAGLSLIGVSGAGWTCSPSPPQSGPVTVTCQYTVPAGGLPPGSALPPINFTVKVEKPGPYRNCARVDEAGIVTRTGGGGITMSGTEKSWRTTASADNNQSCIEIPTGGGGACAPLPKGAVAWWPLDEQGGATVLEDIVGNVQAETKQGPVGSPQSPQAVPGMVGGAIGFAQGGPAWAQVTNFPPGGLWSIGEGDFTIDAWVKFPPLPASTGWLSNVAHIVNRLDGTKKQGYSFYVRSPGIAGNERLGFLWGDGTAIYPEVQSTLKIAPDQWHHVAVTFRRLVPAGQPPATPGGWTFELRLYVDGQQAGLQVGGNPVGSLANFLFLEIGGIPGAGDRPIVIDELEFFDRALEQGEIQAIYQAGPAGKCRRPGGAPDLAIAKKPTGPLVAGQQASYQIAVSNVGTADAQGPIVVTDTLGAGLTYVSAVGTGWSCSASGQTVTCTHPGPVPASGSLPPITLTVKVAPDAKEVQNCAGVKAVEQPPSPGMPEVVLPDADASNNRACVVSPVGPGEGKPAKVCGVKFLDHDGDGVRDANEPGLPNWTIQVKDAAGNLVGSAVTGPKGRFCIEVKPGTYTVAEVAKPGWVQTAPQPVPPGTATVTVAAGQTAVVQFGNRPEEKPCCLDFTWQGGKPDNFFTSEGTTVDRAEPATPPPGKPQAYFDETQLDKPFAHRFALPDGNCIREAKLELLARPLHRMPVGVASSRNDTLGLSAGSASWGASFGVSGPSWAPTKLTNTEWVLNNWPNGLSLSLDLANLPGGGNLLAALDAARTLDIAVQDDTSVDYARLVVRFCDCAEKEKEALGAAARGGAEELIILPLRREDIDDPEFPDEAKGRGLMVVNGARQALDTRPVIRGGRTFLPVRALAEALGLEVAWDAAERKVTLTGEDRTIELWVGKPEAMIRAFGWTAAGGMQVPIDLANPNVAPFIENGRLMLPLRFIGEALDLDVSFEPQTQQVTIKRPSSVCTRRDKNGNCVEWVKLYDHP